MEGQAKKKKKQGLVNLKEWKNRITTLWNGLVKCAALQPAKISDRLAMRVVWRPAGGGCGRCEGWSRSKAQCISVAWKKNKKLPCVGFRTVLVFILWRSVEHCEYWTCAWLLSLIVIVLILLCTTEPLSTVFTVRTNTSQLMVNLSLFTIIPADAKMLQHIWYTVWILDLFFPMELVYIQ